MPLSEKELKVRLTKDQYKFHRGLKKKKFTLLDATGEATIYANYKIAGWDHEWDWVVIYFIDGNLSIFKHDRDVNPKELY